MNPAVYFMVAILASNIFVTIADPTICPKERQCGDKKCKLDEVCELTCLVCEYSCTDPSCTSQCTKRECDQLSCDLIDCMPGYHCEVRKVKGCGKTPQATCVPDKHGCGHQR